MAFADGTKKPTTAAATDDTADDGLLVFPRRARSKVKKSEALWLMSFSDMSLILMSFFILILSFSKTDMQRYDNVTSGLKAQARPSHSSTDLSKEAAAQVAKVENLKTISERVERLIKKESLDKAVQVLFDVDGVAIEFKDAALFTSGSAELSPKSEKTVEQVLRTIAAVPESYKLVFEGHTDDLPVIPRNSRKNAKKNKVDARFDSNWGLSAARGVSLLDRFQSLGVSEQRMSVNAYAHTRPKIPISGLKGAALEAARRSNRRVVIRIQQ
jgi:chemotaxis protein MotB